MINDLRLKVADFLGTRLIEWDYFFVDYWTFAHFLSGVLIMLLIFRFMKNINVKWKFALLFVLLATWEGFEFYSPWIKNEKSIDLIYDLVFGVAGGAVYSYKY